LVSDEPDTVIKGILRHVGWESNSIPESNDICKYLRESIFLQEGSAVRSRDGGGCNKYREGEQVPARKNRGSTHGGSTYGTWHRGDNPWYILGKQHDIFNVGGVRVAKVGR